MCLCWGGGRRSRSPVVSSRRIRGQSRLVRYCSATTNNVIRCVLFLLSTKHFIHCDKKHVFHVWEPLENCYSMDKKEKKNHRIHIADLFKISFKPNKPFIEVNVNIAFRWLLLVWKKTSLTRKKSSCNPAKLQRAKPLKAALRLVGSLCCSSEALSRKEGN